MMQKFVCALIRYKVTQDIPNLLKCMEANSIHKNMESKAIQQRKGHTRYYLHGMKLNPPEYVALLIVSINLVIYRVLSVVTQGLFFAQKASFHLPPSSSNENIILHLEGRISYYSPCRQDLHSKENYIYRQVVLPTQSTSMGRKTLQSKVHAKLLVF